MLESCVPCKFQKHVQSKLRTRHFLENGVWSKTTEEVITFLPTSPDCIIRKLASGRDLVNCQGNQL